MIFDFENNRSDDGVTNEDIDEYFSLDSGYNSNKINFAIIKDIDKCYTTEIDGYKKPLR